MAKYTDIKEGLAFIRKGYSKEAPFSFTLSEIADATELSEKKARGVLESINTRAQFWKGNFPPYGENLVVSSRVFDRLQGWFE